MPTEIEAKIKVDNLEPIRQRLVALGAKKAGEHLETNTFFDAADASLRRADKGLRLRANQEITAGRTEYIVTFKGPRQAGQFKTRQEIEFTVSDPKATAAVLEALGFNASLSFQKRRRSWELGDCKVELDELPYLGTFVEIEGPTPEKIAAVRQQIGLADQPTITTSYTELISRYLQENHIAAARVEFPA
jgi:adenylate cyclase, class 2